MSVSNPQSQPPDPNQNIEEGICQPCGKPYPVWFAPNELWNKVMRYPDGREASEKYAFICMDCFALEAEKVGVKPTAWMLTVETKKEAEAPDSGHFVHATFANPIIPPDQNIEQQIDEILQPIRNYVDIVEIDFAKIAILALISKQVSEARIDELERMHEKSFHWGNLKSRSYKGAIAGFIEDYYDRLTELKQTPPTPNAFEKPKMVTDIKVNGKAVGTTYRPPNGDERGALANPSTPTALSKQADNPSEVA